MPNVNETVAGLTITAKTEGVDQAKRQVDGLTQSTEQLGIVSETTSKRVLSLEDAWKRQSLRLDEAARAQANIARETKLADAALREGVATQAQHAQRLDQINQRYGTASASTKEFTQQTGLARHELINLGRQAQDVGVSLVSGQSPLMVLAQQGSQIADVFISSGKSVGSFFTQAIGWAGRFAGSIAGITTAVAGTTAAVGYMVSSFVSAQKEIDKVLSGTGAASGATRGGINRIAEGAAGGGMSTADARQAALTFAATGKIYEQNINTATNVTREFARAMGIDTADAAKQLAAALIDPSKGALDLNKQIAFLDATTLNYIRTLQSQGKLQEAQNVLMAAAAPAVGKQAQQVSVLTRAWDAAAKALADFDEANAKAIARSLQRMTGADLGGFSIEEQLGKARQTQQGAQQALGSAQDLGLGPRAMKALEDAARTATVEVERLEQKLADAAKAAADQRFNQLTLAVDAFTRAVIPSIEQVEKLTLAIETMERAKAAGATSPNQDAALAVARMQLSIAMETVDVERRKAEVFAQNALAYQNVSATTAQTLATMQGQLTVAQQVTGLAQINAQHEATINSLKQQGLSLSDAIAVADMQRATALAQVETAAKQQLRTLREEYEVITASSEEEKGRIRARQQYDNLVRSGVSRETAGAIAAQMQANARATQDAADATESWSVQMDNANDAINRVGNSIGNAVDEMARLVAESNRLRAALSFVPTITLALGRGTDALSQSNQGGYSQFNPGGYTSDLRPNLIEDALTRTYGQGGYDPKTGMPNEQGIKFQQNQAVRPETGTTMAETFLENLKTELSNLTSATKDNTSATQAMTDVLSPYYSSDPRRTHLGFRAFAGGGIMTPYGELPLKQYQSGGIANSPQVAVYGEGSTAEAYVPVPSGKIPVELRMPANSNRPVVVNINVRGNADASTVAALKATAFQQAQAMRRVVG